MTQDEDFSDTDDDEFDLHSTALQDLVQDYLDEQDLSERAGAVLLLSMSIKMRMIGYAMETDQPSASGLKMDFDRFEREIADCIRTAKKSADEFIAEAKAVRAGIEEEVAALEAEHGEHDGNGDGDEEAQAAKRRRPS